MYIIKKRYNGIKKHCSEVNYKRGQLYSLITILIAIPLVLFLTVYISSTQTLKSGSLEKVISDQMKEIENSIEDDFLRAIGISGHRALLAAIDKIVTDGIVMDNATLRLEELMINGTLFGDDVFLMQNNTLGDWRDKILAVQPGFNTYLQFSNFSVRNFDSFNIMFSLNLDINVSDKLNTAKISKSITRNVLVSLEGLEDPIFPLKTNGAVTRIIRRYTFSYYAKQVVSGEGEGDCSGNITFDSGDPDSQKILIIENASGISGFLGVVSETNDNPSVSCYIKNANNAVTETNQTIYQSDYKIAYLDNKTKSVWHLPINGALRNYYVPVGSESTGPDMLQRLEGNLNESVNGLETFVDIEELQLFVPIEEDKTVLDYLYFSDSSEPGDPVKGLPDWFRIDEDNEGRYNLTLLIED